MQAYLHTKNDDNSCFLTREVEIKAKYTNYTKLTKSGYGCDFPSDYMIKVNNKWRRVYIMCYGNGATLYIKNYGKNTVDIYN